MPVTVQDVPESHHLSAGGIFYEFHPQPGGGAVAIVVIRNRHRDTYCLPPDEARQLYARLLKAGYHKF